MSDIDLNNITDSTGLNVQACYKCKTCGKELPVNAKCSTYLTVSDIDRIDEKLDELLSELRSGTINFDADSKQAIKQFIASELSKRLNAHYADGLGTYDYDGIAESMIEWLGELKGEGK